jgi:hypothetical protein
LLNFQGTHKKLNIITLINHVLSTDRYTMYENVYTVI